MLRTLAKAYFFLLRGLFIATSGAAAFLRVVLRRAGLRFAAFRFAGFRLAALRFAGLRFAAFRFAGFRLAALRFAGLRFAERFAAFFGIWFTSLHRSDDLFHKQQLIEYFGMHAYMHAYPR